MGSTVRIVPAAARQAVATRRVPSAIHRRTTAALAPKNMRRRLPPTTPPRPDTDRPSYPGYGNLPSPNDHGVLLPALNTPRGRRVGAAHRAPQWFGPCARCADRGGACEGGRSRVDAPLVLRLLAIEPRDVCCRLIHGPWSLPSVGRERSDAKGQRWQGTTVAYSSRCGGTRGAAT
ncbi:hypothetical protein NOCARDAX2BIS_520119 [Nocardioides sp. AX2bis]|nr:hypothetical protein NOCARDAX2BIS_520119 [Nocardioides sp. AX2bis]